MNEKDQMDWFIKKDSEVLGPMTWKDITFMKRAKELNKLDHIKSSMDEDWIQICDFTDFDEETSSPSEGILPDGTDAVFLLGLLAFFIGAGLYFLNPFYGDAILITSLAMEIGSVAYSIKYKLKGAAKTVGNIIAISWICLQGFITVFFIINTFT